MFDAAGTRGAQTHDLPFAKREHYHLATATSLTIGMRNVRKHMAQRKFVIMN
jgi:hypothetical protein